MQTQHIALSLFLFLLAIGTIILVSILIVIKRRIARRKSRVGRTAYTPCGHGLPKVWKENIEKKINSTVKIRTEPRVSNTFIIESLGSDSSQSMKSVEINLCSSFELLIGDNTYVFRAKAVDEFIALKQAILSVDPRLEAPPIRDIRDFLLNARQHAMSPPASREKIEEYCRLYLWARHDIDSFGEGEYKRLRDLQSLLLELVSRASTVNLYTSPSSLGHGKDTNRSVKYVVSNRVSPSSRIILPSASSASPEQSEFTHTAFSSDDKVKFGQPKSSRIKSITKPTGTGLALKRLSHGHRKKHELLVSQPDNEPEISGKVSSQVFSNEAGEMDSSIDLTLAATTSTGSTTKLVGHLAGRRDSCQSDGSQTALIDLEPAIISPKSSVPASRQTPYSPLESKNTVRYVKGMENEGINC